MNKLVIDVGNTLVKGGLFNEKGELAKIEVAHSIHEIIEKFETANLNYVYLSSVKKLSEINISIPFGVLDDKSILPFKNLYKTPETLGRDRIAAVAAASVLYPHTPVLILDIGTCMTIDFINASNEYLGGNISPGINMRLKAMNLLTDKLPLSSKDCETDFLGDSTLSALANGAIVGMSNEIEGYIVNFMLNYPDLKVVFCGGDAIFFEKRVKNKIFADPNFVLQGLYQLLLLNEKN